MTDRASVACFDPQENKVKHVLMDHKSKQHWPKDVYSDCMIWVYSVSHAGSKANLVFNGSQLEPTPNLH